MYRIEYREDLTPNIHLFKIAAPAVAKKAQAGQFVIVMVDEKGERIPLTVADWDRANGTVTVVFMEAGKTTRKLATLAAGEYVRTFVGPLGQPTEVGHFGTVACVAGGFAIATIVPIAQAMKEAGNQVVSVMGFRNKALVFWEDRLRSVSDELIVTTDDGSYGRGGLVTGPLRELLEARKDISRVIAIGPTVMMRACAEATRPFGVKTIVSLNTIMIDGTGMCGGCRVEVGSETRFTCVDGPDFDGHLVNWDLLLARQRIYVDEERRALGLWEEQCRLGAEKRV